MERIHTGIVLILLAGVLIAGCSNVDDLRKGKNEIGHVDIFDAPYDMIYETTLNVLQFQGADILEESKAGKYIFAKQGISHVGLGCFSYGELIGAYFENLDKDHTRLKIVQKKRNKWSIPQQHWETKIFTQIRQQLNLKTEDAKA